MSKTQVFKIANTVFLVCFFLFNYSLAQSPQLLTPKQKQLQLNKIQVNDLLRYIEEDGKKVNLIDSSLLHVRLGDILWESNKEKSQIEFKAAVNQLVKAISEFQEVKDGGKYKFNELIAVSSNLLENISGKNKQLEEVLVNEMIGLADKNNLSSQKKSQLLSNALAQAALGFIKNNKKGRLS